MELSAEYPDLAADNAALLASVGGNLAILADLSRSDLLLYLGRPGSDVAAIIGQAQPHSVSPIYETCLVGKQVHRQDESLVFRALRESRAYGELLDRGAPVWREVHPVTSARGEAIGAVSIDTNLVERERHSRRSPVFRHALASLQLLGLRAALPGVEALTPFAEHDGLLFVDLGGRVRYVSGVAENLHRKLGFGRNLVRGQVAVMGGHERVFRRVLETRRCLEEETQEGQFVWIRKGIPVAEPPRRLTLPWRRGPAQDGISGVLIAVHDATDARRKEQELRIKSAMIQEIHHRVKNNLQTIAALLRLQARRVPSPDAQMALHESVGRILSVAVVHEFLSQDEGAVINIKEVSQRILALTRTGILDPSKGIRLSLTGDSFLLPAQRATACALIINELVQNAVEHGYTDRHGGTISLSLAKGPDEMVIEVADDGEGLPSGFDLDQTRSLGLKIVQSLVKEDLKGTFELTNGHGVRAVVRFPASLA